jgi:Zn-dependent metalloprotease
MSAGRSTLVLATLLASLGLACPGVAVGGSPSGSAGRDAAVARALGLLKSHGADSLASSADRFVVRDVVLDADGTEHVRFERRYGGLPVIGGDLVVHAKDGKWRGASLAQSQRLALDLSPRVQADDAIVAAGAEFGGDFAGVPSAALVVYARGRGSARLAWRVRMDGGDGLGNPVEMVFIVDAQSERILDRWSALETAKPLPAPTCLAASSSLGQGRTLYAGAVPLTAESCGGASYTLRDPSRGNAATMDLRGATSGEGVAFTDADNVWGRGSVSDRASAGADAHYGMASTWDYFLQVHGRPGVDGLGNAATSRVHFGRGYANAFWSEECFCISYGDGDGRAYGPMVNLDIAGHEISHGVTNRTAGLLYSGESGALNEATSDIFGTMVEYYANNATDRPDYTIGEEVMINGGGKALRYMFKPSLDGASADCWSSDVGRRDVHLASGVANHFFYLLAEGAVAPAGHSLPKAQLVCNGNVALAGIGRDKAQRIWYRALTVYFTSTSDFAGARAATQQAARDLYDDTTALAVARAWSAVNVN